MVSARTALSAVVGAIGVAAATVVAIDRRWRRAEDPCARSELPEGRPLRVTTDDGAVLDVAVHGDGPLVVLSHCWTGSREIWAPVACRLVEQGHQVVLYDQRGHGRSTGEVGDIDIARLGHDLAAVLEAVDARDAVVAGHSMGGMSVQALVAERPDVVERRVRGLVLVATAASVAVPGPAGRARAALALRAIAAPGLQRVMASGVGHALVRGTVGRGPCYGHLCLTRDTFVATPGPVRAACLGAMLRMDLRPGLASIRTPTTVVIGALDRLTPPRLGRALADAIAEAGAVEVPDAGHMLPLERPDLVAELIAAHHRTTQLANTG